METTIVYWYYSLSPKPLNPKPARAVILPSTLLGALYGSKNSGLRSGAMFLPAGGPIFGAEGSKPYLLKTLTSRA